MKYCFLLLSLFLSIAALGQGNTSIGILPNISLTKKINTQWKVNYSYSNRNLLRTKKGDNIANDEYQYILSDNTLIFSKKANVNGSFGFGYLWRLEKGEPDTHRSLIQYSFKQSFDIFKLNHRVRADQTFQQDNKVTHRFRYRISALFSIQGEKLDSKEFYVKLNHEYLSIFKPQDFDFEIRLTPLLGYVFNDKNKIEVGLDWRISSVLDKQTNQNFWLNINSYLIL